MTKLCGSQLSLIAESDFEELPVGDWDYDELGTNNFLVPNSSVQKLGTNKFLVPNFPPRELGTNNFLVPNFPATELGTKEWTPPDLSEWKPPMGCLQQKWIKDHQYWYWRYYDNRGKKASLYLHKDYNKAVRKAIKIGVPHDAKPLKSSASQADTQSQTPTQLHPVHIASTADGASGNTIAA